MAQNRAGGAPKEAHRNLEKLVVWSGWWSIPGRHVGSTDGPEALIQETRVGLPTAPPWGLAEAPSCI